MSIVLAETHKLMRVRSTINTYRSEPVNLKVYFVAQTPNSSDTHNYRLVYSAKVPSKTLAMRRQLLMIHMVTHEMARSYYRTCPSVLKKMSQKKNYQYYPIVNEVNLIFPDTVYCISYQTLAAWMY